jgi:exonuclease VII large subunit
MEASEARLIQALPSETNLVAQMNERLDQQTNQMTQQMTHQMTHQNMMMANSMENFMHQLSQQFGIQPATPSNGRHPGAPPFVRRLDHQSNDHQPELQSNLDETSDNLDQSMQGTSFSEAQDSPTLSAFTATINGDRLSPIPPTTHGDATTTATTAPAKENINTSDTSMMSGCAE